MIEFAVVLGVKRKFELDNKKFQGIPAEFKLETKPHENRPRMRIQGLKVESIQEMSEKFQKESYIRMQNKRLAEPPPGFWLVSSTTDKIDLMAFTVFILSYFMFNCGYWFAYI